MAKILKPGSRTAAASRHSLKIRKRDPRVQYRNRLNAALFNNHFRALTYPLRSPLPEDVSDLDYDELLSFFRERFTHAGDFTFFFVGAFEPEELKQKVTQWIASLPDGGKQETARDNGLDYFTENIRDEIYAGIEPLAIVTLAWSDEILWNYDTLYDFSALSSALNIRLIELVREEVGGTYSINASFTLNRVPDEDYLFTINFSTEPERVQELTTLIRNEITSIVAEGLGEEYAQRVSESQRVSYEENLERNGWWLGQIEFLTKNDLGWEYALEKTAWYDELSADDIQNSAKRVFENSSYAEIILFPEKE